MEGDIARPVGFQSLRALFYGWWLVAIGAFILAVAGSEVSLSLFTQYFFVLLRGYVRFSLSGWPYILYNAVAAASSALQPFVGMAVDRWGSRRLMLIGLPLAGIGMAAMGLSPRVALVSGAFPLVSVGARLGTYVPVVVAANHWFRRRRATAIAILLFVLAVAGALVMQMPEPVIQQGILAAGLLVLIIALPLALLVRNRPEAYGEHPDGVKPREDELVPEYTVREAVRSREFWLFALATACLGAVGEVAAWVSFRVSRDDYTFPHDELDTFGMVVHILFILVGGYVGDRIPLRRALLWFALLHPAAIVTSLIANGVEFYFLAAALLGMGTGGVQCLSVAALGAYFGRNRFGTILGIYLIVSGMLSNVAFSSPFLLNHLFHSHSSIVMAVAATVLSAIGVAGYLLVRDPRPSLSQTPTASVEQEGG